MNKLKVGIDLDGVLWDLIKYWLDEYNEITGENINPNDIKTYEIAEYVKYPEMLWHILENGRIWDKIELYPNISDVITSLKDSDLIDFKIVTSTYYKIVLRKFNRLFELLPILDRSDVIVTDDKSWVDLDVLIDDYEENLLNSNAPLKLLINQPYNKWVNDNHIHRVYDLLDAYIFILNTRGDINEC